MALLGLFRDSWECNFRHWRQRKSQAQENRRPRAPPPRPSAPSALAQTFYFSRSKIDHPLQANRSKRGGRARNESEGSRQYERYSSGTTAPLLRVPFGITVQSALVSNGAEMTVVQKKKRARACIGLEV